MDPHVVFSPMKRFCMCYGVITVRTAIHTGTGDCIATIFLNNRFIFVFLVNISEHPQNKMNVLEKQKRYRVPMIYEYIPLFLVKMWQI